MSVEGKSSQGDSAYQKEITAHKKRAMSQFICDTHTETPKTQCQVPLFFLFPTYLQLTALLIRQKRRQWRRGREGAGKKDLRVRFNERFAQLGGKNKFTFNSHELNYIYDGFE